jgi:hypothetical protein
MASVFAVIGGTLTTRDERAGKRDQYRVLHVQLCE